MIGTPVRVVKVFNNNVVLAAEEDGRLVVFTGRGLGFQKRPGDHLEAARVVQRFVPEDSRDPSNFAQLVSAIPHVHLVLADSLLTTVQAEGLLGSDPGSTTLVALADHLTFALTRLREGIDLTYPLRAEIAHLYPMEMAAGDRIIELVNAHLADGTLALDPDGDTGTVRQTPVRSTRGLPPGEAVAVALHLVNAGLATGDLAATYRMTGMINQVFEVIESFYARPFPRESVNAARFITHLRYFFVRATQSRQVVETSRELAGAIIAAYPRSHACAVKVRRLLELRLGHPITESETAYLTLHVARLSEEESPRAEV